MPNTRRPLPLYRDDNTLTGRSQVVETAVGGLEYEVNCAYINGLYYTKGRECNYSEARDRWVINETAVMLAKNAAKQTPSMTESEVLDHETGKTVKSSRGLLNGLVSVDAAGKEEMGWFSPNPYKNCTVTDSYGRRYNCMNYEMLKEPHYVEYIGGDCFYKTAGLSASSIAGLRKKAVIDHSGYSYNAVDNMANFKQAMKLYNESNDFTIDKDVKYAASHIKGFTWGFEVEAINGTVPTYLRNQYGIMICRDGSTRQGSTYPPEYVSVPLSGAKGMQAMRNFATIARKRSDFDIKCSFHLHLGGFEITRVLMVALYKLCWKIQDPLFLMFPTYKQDEVKYARKEKNYCKKLPTIMGHYTDKVDYTEFVNKSYEDLYGFVSGGKRFDSTHNVRVKSNPWGNGNKWDILSRYHWINFTNPVFGKQDTIEFRLHTPTLNGDKMLNWLMMCCAIIKYAQKYPKRCLSAEPISVEDVLMYYAQVHKTNYAVQLSDRLVNYYKSRVQIFATATKNSDYLCPSYFDADGKFSHNALSIT